MLKKCKQKRIDCLLYCPGGQCKGLKDTDFGKRKCPFYKPKKEKEEKDVW